MRSLHYHVEKIRLMGWELWEVQNIYCLWMGFTKKETEKKAKNLPIMKFWNVYKNITIGSNAIAECPSRRPFETYTQLLVATAKKSRDFLIGVTPISKGQRKFRPQCKSLGLLVANLKKNFHGWMIKISKYRIGYFMMLWDPMSSQYPISSSIKRTTEFCSISLISYILKLALHHMVERTWQKM